VVSLAVSILVGMVEEEAKDRVDWEVYLEAYWEDLMEALI